MYELMIYSRIAGHGILRILLNIDPPIWSSEGIVPLAAYLSLSKLEIPQDGGDAKCVGIASAVV